MTIEERNRLVEQHLHLVDQAASRLLYEGLPSYIEAEDMKQDARLRMIGLIEAFETVGRNNATLPTFLRGAIRNDMLDFIEAKKTEYARTARPGAKLVMLRKRSERLDLRSYRNLLNQDEYDSVLYTAILGFTTREAGNILSCAQNTVSNRVRSAIEKMRRKNLSP